MPKLLFNQRDHAELTYDDAFLVPNNPIVDRLLDTATEAEVKTLMDSHKDSLRYRTASLLALKKTRGKGDPKTQLLALESHKIFRRNVLDLAAKYPDIAKSHSRDEVDFSPADGFGNTPIVVANMNNVTGKRMAEAAAMMGGSAAYPQDKDDDEFKDVGEYLHTRELQYMTPVVVGPKTRVHDLRDFLNKRDVDTAIVTDNGQQDGKFLGIVKFQRKDEKMPPTLSSGLIPLGGNEDKPVSLYMRTEGIATRTEGVSYEEAAKYMDDMRVHFVPILTSDNRVKGVLTKFASVMQWRYKPHEDEENGGLAMLGTVGALNKNPIDRVKFLTEEVGVKGIVFDTAHFDQGVETYKNVEAAANIIAQSKRKILLVAGNVVAPSAVRDTFAAGADVAKVGIGPGAMCSTRMETGVGRPQLTAVLKAAKEAKLMGKQIWADGGIQYPRDVALALAAGASQVMIGSLLTATYESPGDFEKEGKALYKVNYGMASRHASQLRNHGKLERDIKAIFRETVGHRSEGISEAKVFQKEGLESVAAIMHWIMDGVTSAMTYMGARNLDEFSRYARIGVQNTSGYNEGKPKSIS